LISSNHCLDNKGPGVFLYNDDGQVGSSGNIIANNTLGDDRASPSARTQSYGVVTVGGAEGNIIDGNNMFNNTLSSIGVAGMSNIVNGVVQSPQ
jgi:hypothetical protein